MFEETYLIYLMSRYGKTNETLLAPKKIYAADLGMRNLFTGYRDKGAVFENAVFLAVKSLHPRYVYRDTIELDFFTENKILIEVKYGSEMHAKQLAFFDERLIMQTEKNLSSTQVEPLLKLFIEKSNTKFKERVISIFKIGSLGSRGDFSLCSDVDIALMLDAVKDSDHKDVKEICESIKILNLNFADRLSVFWSSYDKMTFERGEGRFPPLDRLDLIRCGVLLAGVDRRKELSEPSNNDLILGSAEFISKFMLTNERFNELVNHQAEIIRKGARYFSKFVLFPVRLIYSLDNPDKIGTNHDAVQHFTKTYANTMPHAIALIEKAYQSRNDYPDAPVNINLDAIKTILPELYIYCIAQYRKAVSNLKRDDITAKLQLEIERISNFC